jgi:predicted regulator of Ras-like GTPase activity (Roadblock/LC7/MglB family)
MPDAIRRWTEELARDPHSLSFLPLAEALRRKRQHGEALAVALRGLERHPYLPDAHDLLARIAADSGDGQRARDEWETVLRLEPRHVPALKGLGFLAFRAGDLPSAQRLLRSALEADPGDAGARAALERIARSRRRPARTPAAVAMTAAVPQPGFAGPPLPAARQARELFAPLLGDGDRTALLLDRDGLVLAGAYVDEDGRDASDDIGAELSGVSDEATRALDNLGLGAWESILVEAQHATVALAPVQDGTMILVAAARDTSIGLVRRLQARARQRAGAWLGAAQ